MSYIVNKIFGWVIPYTMTKNGKLRMLPSTRLETPGIDIGIVLLQNQLKGTKVLALRDGRMQSWGEYPIEEEHEVTIQTRKLDYDNPRKWFYYKGFNPRITKSKAANQFPKLCTGKEVCLKCKDDRAYWQAHSYASGLTMIRTYNFCLNCTFKPRSYRSISKPSGPRSSGIRGGQYRCRICGERGSDLLLHEETDGLLSFQVPIHESCRGKILDLKGKTASKWWDMPSNIKIEL